MCVIFGGIYSELYKPNYLRLKSQLQQNGVPDDNIIFKEVPQSIFTTKSGCTWCNPTACKFAFHSGEDCKIKHQLELYKRFKDTNVHIIYLDTDVVLNQKIWKDIDFPAMLGNNDMVFEHQNGTKRWCSNVNIGFTLCEPTEKIIKFYELVLEILNKQIHPLNWDQQVVNHCLLDKQYKFSTTRDTGFNHSRSGGTGKMR